MFDHGLGEKSLVEFRSSEKLNCPVNPVQFVPFLGFQ